MLNICGAKISTSGGGIAKFNALVVLSSIIATMTIVVIVYRHGSNSHFEHGPPIEQNLRDRIESTTELQLPPTPRVLCWILTGPANHQTKAVHVQRTWGSRCNKLLFMSSEFDEALGAIALPNVTEGRNWLWAKTKEAHKYLWEHHRHDAEWFLKADDDTYVFMENLRSFLREHDPMSPGFFGCRVKYHDIPHTVNYGGPGYVLSREALRVFVEESLPNKTSCRQEHDGDEDTELSICLANSGIPASKTTDSLGGHRFIWTTPLNIFNPDKAGWGPVVDPLKPGLECCSDSIISFHHLEGPQTMYLLEFMAYKFQLT